MSLRSRPPFEKWYSYVLFIFIGYCLADLTILAVRDQMLPTQPPPARPKPPLRNNNLGRGAYGPISTRNIFSSKGEIPDPWRPAGQKDGDKKNEEPIPSNLPLTLLGTMVHSNPEKSIAAIDIRGKNRVTSYTPHRDIENMATVEKIERRRVYLRNASTGGLEFIEMKDLDSKLSFSGSSQGISEEKQSPVLKLGETDFQLKRSDLLKYTSDLSSLLMQARAVPNRDPSTGEINGFRLIDYQPNSIFAQLGIPKMALIKSVDGTPVTSPATAMELYNTLKNNNKVTVQIENNGQIQNYTYTIK